MGLSKKRQFQKWDFERIFRENAFKPINRLKSAYLGKIREII